MSSFANIEKLLGSKAKSLLGHVCKVSKDKLHVPGPDWVDRIFAHSDRNIRVLRNFQALLNSGRLAKTGYLSILPVDQGIEHSAGASFAKNPEYFDPENIVKLAIEGGCNAVASTLGVLSLTARKYAHKIPFLLKFNHNELLHIPIPMIKFYLHRLNRPMKWAARLSVRPSILDHLKATIRSKKSLKPLKWPMSLAW